MPIEMLSPSEIVNNSPLLDVTQKMISKFIYHFTDVNNAGSILNSGLLLARNTAIAKGLMVNDNASQMVIAGTDIDVHDYVRFYFRPKTPTQYHNEGIRSKEEIHPEYKAHCPVPIFFLFDFNSIIADERAYFSYESLASYHHVELYNYNQSPDALKAAPFHHIYHNGAYSNDERIINKRRHAEVIIKRQYELTSLKHIYCRNENEATTLKSLLAPKILEKYENLICVPNNISDYFNDNYLSVDSVYFEGGQLHIEWKQRKLDSVFKFRFEIYTSDESKQICYGNADQYVPFIQTNDNMYWQTATYLVGHSSCLLMIYLDENLIYKGHHTL